MGVQKSCSLVMLGRQGALARAFSHQERYMLHTGAAHNAVDATLEYSRPVRSLKLWLALRIYGAEVLRGWIAQNVAHARDLTAAIRQDPRFELLHEPTLSTVCFRYLGSGDSGPNGAPQPAGDEELDDLNRRLADAITRDGRVYLAAATVDGRTCLRVCFTNFRTRDEHVTELFSVVREIAAEL
jgi:aromatic-L-amino-acid/L-tryptophan decarboxylase